MSRCHSVVENKNARCLNLAAFGSRYCRRHYPKKNIFIGMAAGVLTGICLVSFLHLTMGDFLESLLPFHYLDRNPPQIKMISPDLRRFKNSDPLLQTFLIEPVDLGSGMDWKKSRMALQKHAGGKTEEVPGHSWREGPYLMFEAVRPFDPGDYSVEAVLLDRAGRENQFLDSFSVEVLPLGFSVRRHFFLKDPRPERFQRLLGSSSLPPEQLMVYRIDIFHQSAASVVFKNIKIQMELPGPILAFHEMGSSRTDRQDPFPLQSRSGSQKQKFLPDRKWIEIGELNPHGMIAFEALVHCKKIEACGQAVLFSGAYDSHSYQHSGPNTVGLWVPALQEEKR